MTASFLTDDQKRQLADECARKGEGCEYLATAIYGHSDGFTIAAVRSLYAEAQERVGGR